MAFRPHFLCWAALSLVAWLPLRAMNTEGGGDDGVRPRGGRQHAYVDDGTDPSQSRGDLQRPSSSSPPPHPGAGLPSSSSLQSLGASSSSCPSNLRPWSPRTVALYMAAVWDENFSLAAQFDPTECNSLTVAPLYLEQLSRGMHELALVLNTCRCPLCTRPRPVRQDYRLRSYSVISLNHATLMYRYHLLFNNFTLYENLWKAENKIITLLTLVYHLLRLLYHWENIRIKVYIRTTALVLLFYMLLQFPYYLEDDNTKTNNYLRQYLYHRRNLYTKGNVELTVLSDLF
eukprot:s1996_g6.t1